MKILETRKVGIYTVNLRDDGILHYHTSDEKPATVEGFKELVKVIGEIVNYKKVPIFNTRDSFALPSTENRMYVAQKDSLPYSSADAYLMNSMALQIMGKFYVSNEKPGRPTKIFLTEEDAIEWLKTFL